MFITRLLYHINNFILFISLILIPIIFYYQSQRTADFIKANPDGKTGYMAILYGLLFYGFMYLIPFLIWNRLLKPSLVNKKITTLLQVVVIFLLGSMPAVVLVWIGFTAK